MTPRVLAFVVRHYLGRLTYRSKGWDFSASLTLPTLTVAGATNTVDIQILNGPAATTLAITPSSSNATVATISGPTSQPLTAGQLSPTLAYTVTALVNGTTTISISIKG